MMRRRWRMSTQFAERVYLKHDLAGFTGDREFVGDNWAQKSYAKLRSSIAGVYAWRAGHGDTLAEKQRMAREADFAYRQAFALCPNSPEVVFGYAQLLVEAKRHDDALTLLDTALKLDPTNVPMQGLRQQIINLKRTP
jgi:predicted Zn-dependent protease